MNTQTHRELLTFLLGDEEYAIDILRVQEIRAWEPATPIAQAPDFIKGVINLRGAIVPVIDLRIRFGLGHVEYTSFTVTVILNVGDRTVGIVVDAVSDVVSVSEERLLPPPAFSGAIDVRHIVALAALDERMLIVVDIENLMLSADMALTDELETEQ
ncbi:MAG TPA: chemotaxis protein CheW [Rhodocyclaceae bacterium]|jgi:purine-binding chemotaxis protein CheW|nr:chemotaxis protein CheW [Rhodocyclaceae bacterium]